MHRGRNYSEDLIDNVITLFDEGLTSTQVAKIINKRFNLNELQDRKTEQDELNLSKERLQLALRG
jgi:hypothetical protein